MIIGQFPRSTMTTVTYRGVIEVSTEHMCRLFINAQTCGERGLNGLIWNILCFPLSVRTVNKS